MSDNADRIAVFHTARAKIAGLANLWRDSGFKHAFSTHSRERHVASEVVTKVHPPQLSCPPQRWAAQAFLGVDREPPPPASRL